MTEIVVGSGQTSSGITLSGGDTMEVLSGGTALHTTVLSGGGLTVDSGGIGAGTVLKGSAYEFVDSGGIAIGGRVTSGGELVLARRGVGRRILVGSGGSAVVEVGGRIVDPVISGGTLYLDGGLAGPVDFAGSGGNLVIGRSPPGSGHVISGLVPGDIIDLGARFASGGSATLVAGNELQISEGGRTYTLFLDPKQDFSGFVFTVAGEGFRFRGTEVVEHSAKPADIHVGAGQSLSGTYLFFGDTMVVSAGGSATRTILDGGDLTLAGGTARRTLIGAGGEMFVSAAGLAANTVVSGKAIVSSGGIARGTIVEGGGEIILAGGRTVGELINEYGVAIVSAGGIANGLVLEYTTEEVLSGGIARGTVVNAGSREFVASGGRARGTIFRGGEEELGSGVVVRDTAVSSGTLYVDTGAVAFATAIGGGGTELVDGIARGTVVSGGGEEAVFGIARGTVVRRGGEEFVLGGVADGTVVGDGGFEEVIIGGATARGTVIDSGGTAKVSAGGRIVAPVISGGTLVLGGPYGLGGAIDFAGSGGGLVISAARRLPSSAHVIAGFAPGDTIDLAAVTFTSGGSATLGAGNELQISEGGKTYKLYFDPKQDFSGFVFTWAGDGHGGTLVSEETTPAAASEMRWLGAAPVARPAASPHLVDSGTGTGQAAPASLAHVSGGGFGQG